MITKESSFFKLPKNLNEKQIFLIEGIRLCFNSISLSHKTLFNELVYISNNNLRKESHTLIFKEAWQQIDISHRLYNLLLSFGFHTTNDLVFLKQVKSLRNTFQHIDERIDEFLSEVSAPLWGNITWVRVNDESSMSSINSYVLTAGHARHNSSVTLINPAGKIFREKLDFITLESVQKNAADKIVTIDLSTLFRTTENLIKELEIELAKQMDDQYGDKLTAENVVAQDIFACVNMIPTAPNNPSVPSDRHRNKK